MHECDAACIQQQRVKQGRCRQDGGLSLSGRILLFWSMYAPAQLPFLLMTRPPRDHYPPKALPERESGLDLGPPGSFPFTARTEHMDQFHAKPRMGRPFDPLSYTPQPLPWTGKETTNQALYKPFVFAPGGTAPRQPARTAGMPPPADPTDYSTSYRCVVHTKHLRTAPLHNYSS